MNLSVIVAYGIIDADGCTKDGAVTNCPEKVTDPLALMLGTEYSSSSVGVLDVGTEGEEDGGVQSGPSLTIIIHSLQG